MQTAFICAERCSGCACSRRSRFKGGAQLKKILALLLTFCLTFYCGAAAFAEDVSAVAATSTGTFQIDNTSIAIKVGESAVITAYENGSPTMNATWTVSNPSIASVSQWSGDRPPAWYNDRHRHEQRGEKAQPAMYTLS